MRFTHYLRTYLAKLLLFFVALLQILGNDIALANEGFLGQEKVLFRIDKVKVLGNRMLLIVFIDNFLG